MFKSFLFLVHRVSSACSCSTQGLDGSSHLWKAHFWLAALCISPWAASLGWHSSSFAGAEIICTSPESLSSWLYLGSEAQSNLPRHSFSITHKEGSQWVLRNICVICPIHCTIGCALSNSIWTSVAWEEITQICLFQLRVAASSCSCYSKIL